VLFRIAAAKDFPVISLNDPQLKKLGSGVVGIAKSIPAHGAPTPRPYAVARNAGG
jgi:hypothetical protein